MTAFSGLVIPSNRSTMGESSARCVPYLKRRRSLRYRCRMDNDSICVTLNGQATHVAAATSVSQLLVLAGHGERRVAVECNGEIVPRSQHATHLVKSGDRVEIVQAIGGG